MSNTAIRFSLIQVQVCSLCSIGGANSGGISDTTTYLKPQAIHSVVENTATLE